MFKVFDSSNTFSLFLQQIVTSRGFPHTLSTSWLLFLQSVAQPIPNHVIWVTVDCELSSTLLLGKIALPKTQVVDC